jgi:hypothetical protein
MYDSLVKSSIELTGSYANGNGKQRYSVQEALGRKGVGRVTGELDKIRTTMTEAEASPAAQGRWGGEAVQRVGRTAIEQTGLDDHDIANIAVSELDPNWVLTAKPEQIVAMAGLLVASRDIAKHFHELAIQAVNAD